MRRLSLALSASGLVAVAIGVSGGCASILGVDSDDYTDAALLVCACAKDRDNCAKQVEKAIGKDAELENVALKCLEETTDPECGDLAACVRETGVCIKAAKQQCLVDKDGNEIVGCCEGLSCDGAKCCALEGTGCGPGDCCESLRCEAGACVASEDGGGGAAASSGTAVAAHASSGTDASGSGSAEASTGAEVCREEGDLCAVDLLCCGALTCGDDHKCR